MRPAPMLSIVVFALLAAGPCRAADRAVPTVSSLQPAPLAQPGQFPVSKRAARLRGADACWRACQLEAARRFRHCLPVYGVSACVNATAGSDRSCLATCRIAAGPWLILAP
jgi:hypothetical protein